MLSSECVKFHFVYICKLLAVSYCSVHYRHNAYEYFVTLLTKDSFLRHYVHLQDSP
jgi:hypothetical protein